MELRAKALWGLGALAAITASFAAGRYSVPTKTETTTTTATHEAKHEEVKTSEASHEETKQVAAVDRTITKKRIYNKRTGVVAETTTIHETAHTDKSTTKNDLRLGESSSNSTLDTKSETKTVVTREKASFALEARTFVSLSLPLKANDYQIEAQKRILGPGWLGLGFAHIAGKNYVTASARIEF